MLAASGETMPEWLQERARRSPEQLALLCGGDALTYAELDVRTGQAAARLAEAGVRRGDLVALLAANGTEFATVVHALPRLGAVLLPLNTRLSDSELSWQLRHSAAALLVSDRPDVGSLADGLPAAALADVTSATDARPDQPLAEVELSSVHSVIYTSGTSGRPKAAMLTYGNHLASATASAANLGVRPDDRWLACMPLFHVGGLAILLRSVIYGTAAIIHESFDAEAVNASIEDDGVTVISVVSTMLQRMLDARGERPYPPALRCVLLGGGPAPESLIAACRQRGVPVVQTYGLTEAASQVATRSIDDERPGAAGRPLPGTEVRIALEDGREANVGLAGEIIVRGPTVTPGYLNDPDASARAIRDGWLHTGDAGYVDGEGYLHVLDRRDDLILTGGENVYPAEVEETLRSHSSVADAAVVGLPDETWGSRVAAAVALRPGTDIDAAALLSYCRQRLAGYKTPTEIRFVDSLPRNAAGKLLRRTVREQWPARDGA